MTAQRRWLDVQTNAHELTVRCMPKDIPSHIDVNIEGLHIGEAIHVGDLQIPGIEFLDAPDKTIVSVTAPRGEEGTETGAEASAAGTEE